MAFTGDLEHLHIVDIIQLLNTTRKSGTFSVRGSRGESRLIFSNGSLVGASHLNNKVCIGGVLIGMHALAPDDLKKALEIQKKAGKDRKPLIATLIGLGKLGRDDAAKGLKKLIEITLVELIGWTSGTFTLDTDAIVVSPECRYPLSRMEQEVNLDAQMVLMDSLRIFDERERDRQAGKTVPSDEEMFGGMSSPAGMEENRERTPVITADDLGLEALDRLERKIPEILPEHEIFDPAEMHRQKMREIMEGFSAEEQETLVSFLEGARTPRSARGGAGRQDGRTGGLILCSDDELMKHSVMTVCKADDLLVFATDGEEDLYHLLDQCLRMKVLPVVVFDNPETSERILSREKIVSLRQQMRERHPGVSIIQLASLPDYSFMLRSFHDGVRAVFPKPSKAAGRTTFVQDTIRFLESFKSYVRDFFREQQGIAAMNGQAGTLREKIASLRDLREPSAVSLALLQYVSETFERSVSFIVRPSELAGEKSLGVYAGKEQGPLPAAGLKIPLTRPSVFREAMEKGRLFYGETDDEVLREHLFGQIGAPLRRTIILLPMKSRGKTVMVIYGDFGKSDVSPAQKDSLAILADQAGLVAENAFYRRILNKPAVK